VTSQLRLSALLHALVLLAALTLPVSRGDGDEKEAGRARKEEPIDVTIVDPPMKEEDVVTEDGELAALKKRAPHAGDTCAKFYGGIGVVDGMYGITEVVPGYPAHKAGIQVGDEIVSGEPIRGEVGTPVDVTVLRGMRRISFHLVRDKICVA
jgi:hypothetical protein